MQYAGQAQVKVKPTDIATSKINQTKTPESPPRIEPEPIVQQESPAPTPIEPEITSSDPEIRFAGVNSDSFFADM